MDENDTAVETKSPALRDQLAKLIIGTAAGFLASKIVENAYDSLVVARRNNTADPQQ